MIKVALVTHQFPSAEHPYIVDWAAGLLQAGVDLTILSEQAGAPLGSPLRERVCLLNTFGRQRQWLLRNLPASLRGALHVKESLRALRILRAQHPGKPLTALRKWVEYLPVLGRRFNVVHFNAPQIAVRRFELGELLGGKTLVSFRGQDFSFERQKFTPLLERADHLHFISQHLVHLAAQAGYAGGRHTLIPPPIDTQFFKPSPKPVEREPGQPWRLFSAARLTWTKGWEFALQAVALLVQRGWDIEYDIAGEGEMRQALVYTIHELGLQRRVHLLGWQSPEQVRQNMQRSHLYLLASVEEGFNNSVLQAQACGLPVVCSDAGGLPENIADGVTGLLFRRRDAWDMAEKLEKLLGDTGRLTAMRAEARRRADQDFALRDGVQAFAHLYGRLVG